MTSYEGSLRVLGDDGPPLTVIVDLTDDTLQLRTPLTEIGCWPRDAVRIHAEDDGIHLRVEGEEVVLDLRDDAGFAVEAGLRSAPPLLRRRMSALLREEAIPR